VVATWRLVTGSGGEGGRIVGVLRDVTEERAMEEQLRQAQRLETIGMLAGGVAHDFNNLLTAIAGFADLARVSAEDGDSPDADLRQVQAAVERGRALTSQLLAFGRRTVPRPRPVDVGAAMNALVPMLRRLLGEDITILLELEPDVVAIVDPGQLDQVVVNLAVNGRDAMPGGGRLRIAAGHAGSEEPGAGPVTVWLEVEDDGHGMAPELLDRIFVPFFTTKEHGRGTGLGLATVQSIVTGAGGRVDVSSRVGMGTVFRVELPGIAGTRTRDAEVRRPARATGDGLVLLVEDEGLVRQVATRILERAGFRVLSAANAPDALEIAGRQRPEILVSDIRLPGIGDGISLAEALHERWPDLPVLLMTGYTERVPPAWAALLAKPYEADDLIGEVRRLLDEARSQARATAAAGG
jgi:nitrogen-specific signal transduction histidine kinase/ActR/RegA family two-component response regulator